MIQIQKKEDQSNKVLFNGNFIANKPVSYGEFPNIEPYSNLFYFSHAITINACEFGLHPHDGFEIMTFVLDGEISHFDTESKIWTPLKKGDFQIIQSNSGIQHQERISQNSRGFQIWFDPNFEVTTKENPSYKNYQAKDFIPKIENGIDTITYIGKGSKAFSRTTGLTIKKLISSTRTKTSLQLDSNCSYTFYVLNGKGIVNNQFLEKDDALRIINFKKIDIQFEGELFYIQTPTQLDYSTIWTK